MPTLTLTHTHTYTLTLTCIYSVAEVAAGSGAGQPWAAGEGCLTAGGSMGGTVPRPLGTWSVWTGYVTDIY